VLRSRPLYDNQADAAFFSPPEAWDPAMRAIDRGLNTLIVGGRGIGKTTLLRQMQLTLRTQDENVAFVDASAVSELGELVARIRDEVSGAPAPLEAFGQLAASFDRQTPVAGASRQLSQALRELGQADPTTILVDASASAAAVYGFFGRMRDAIWQQHHRWVVAIGDTDRATVLKPPADAFFDVVLELEPWNLNPLIALLDRRLSPGDPGLSRLVMASASQADGNPRQALRALADAVVHDRDPAEALERRSRLLDAASDLGRPTGMLMAELLDRGQASPSDADLQATLGVTRSRLTQILRELLEHQLVTVAAEQPDGPGRPKAVYRPALPR
jgi:energy-coupling factor transporter ATP-binding protein EcfA2/DNA-binding MarR family transcriptional regulator